MGYEDGYGYGYGYGYEHPMHDIVWIGLLGLENPIMVYIDHTHFWFPTLIATAMINDDSVDCCVTIDDSMGVTSISVRRVTNMATRITGQPRTGNAIHSSTRINGQSSSSCSFKKKQKKTETRIHNEPSIPKPPPFPFPPRQPTRHQLKSM